MRRTILELLASLVLAVSMMSCVAVVRTRTHPPPPRSEVRPAPPHRDSAWIDGHWRRQSNGWTWVGGRWERRPWRGAEWVPGHWASRYGGWEWVPGHWRR